MSHILLLNDDDVRQLIPLATAVDFVEEAFLMDAQGKSEAFPVVREELKQHHGIFGIKSGQLLEPETLGLKAGGYWRKNPELRSLSAHQSTIVLFRHATGEPEALMRANYITEARTGAAGAVAASALARSKTEIVTVFGAGRQARVQLQALATRFKFHEARVVARRPDAAEDLAREFEDVTFRVDLYTEPADACRGADIIVTTTPARDPVLEDAWVASGTHINAIGSDTKGKGEVGTDLLGRVRFFADNIDQSLTLGEGQRLRGADAIVGTLGKVLQGSCPGRTDAEEITLFDSTGVTFQDLIMARYALDRAREKGVGREISL